MAEAVKSRARETASGRGKPRARKEATAEERVQPVPWVGMPGVRGCEKAEQEESGKARISVQTEPGR